MDWSGCLTTVFMTPVCAENLLSDLVPQEQPVRESVQFVLALGDANLQRVTLEHKLYFVDQKVVVVSEYLFQRKNFLYSL